MRNIALLFLVLISSSCTYNTWRGNSYTESIGGFFIEENSNSLVGIGSEFHYIFVVERNLIESLKLGSSITFKPTFRNFRLSRNNKISGVLVLNTNKKSLTNDEINILEKYGFIDAGESLSYKEIINGQRYGIDNFSENVISFGNSFQIEVSVPFSNSEITENILLTPVNVVGDAAIITLAIPLGVLYGILLPFN
ncbi:MAG: hypothetical protein R8M14_08850 [Ghiorsea sp.]